VEWIHYGRYLDERIKGKPTQYITQHQEFYGRDFRVTKNVLIPRPETELLVEAVLKLRPDSAEVIDVGTGSGCIAVTLALAGQRSIIAVDVSSAALDVARQNAAVHDADVQFVEGDLLTSFADAAFDVVVSNPPYVPLQDAAGMQREVRDWEPSLALFAGSSGMNVYERLIPQARRALKSGGLLALEMGFGQAQALTSLVRDWHAVEVLPDLAGIPRVLVCKKP